MRNIRATALLTFSIVFFTGLHAHAESGQCREENLVHFQSQGREAAAQLIGLDDPCDGFGGSLMHSPRNGLYIFVNFNIPGVIDLDMLDTAFETLVHPENADWYRRVQLAVVTEQWLKDVHQSDADALLNATGNILFISERVLREERLPALWNDFYGAD